MDCLFINNLIFLTSALVVSFLVYYGSKIFNFQNLFKNFSSITVVKFILLNGLVISFFINSYIFWLYLNYITEKFNNSLFNFYSTYSLHNLNDSYFIVVNSEFFSLDLIGIVFILLVYLVGIISFLALDTRLYWKNVRFFFVCYFLVLAVVFFASVNDILLFFLFYEALLIPSFLFVYFIAPSRRATQASIYFLIWTQVGSFLVLCAVAYIIYLTGNTSFLLIRSFVFTNGEILILYWLLFVGFGIKVPIWPAHYWITKTHVEAPAGFSIFLSGFLVKSAIYGFYKITNLLGGNLSTILASVICYLGVLDASLKMWSQTDLKKLVAYGTIQEMSIIYLAICWGDSTACVGGFLFCITHAFLSSLFFYLVDCVQRRYSTRSILEISGIIHTTPNLGIAILFGLILYSGLPGTLKFISEFYIFVGLIEAAPVSCVILLFGTNFLGLLGFLKCWLNVVFGLTVKDQDKLPVDLTFKEFFIIFLCIGFLFFFNVVVNIFM